MFAKSITTALGFVLLPLMFSMSGIQEEVEPAQGQSSQITGVTQTNNQAQTLWSRPDNSRSAFATSLGLTSQRYGGVDRKILEAAKMLRQADSSEEQAKAREALVDLLAADYDSRLADYEKYLEDLENQLSEMREKLAKRRGAKSKMIDLRIKVLEAEADELGWPSRMNSRWGSSFPGRLESREC